jgi:large subunit ribosomal protein L31e
MPKEKSGVIYIVNLKRLYWGKRSNRAKRAIRSIREFVMRHVGVDEVKIDNSVNNYIWSRGIEKPPRRVPIYVEVHEEEEEEGGRKKVAYVTLAQLKDVEA